LPVDTKKNAKYFIDIIKPQFVVFVKYEFWFNYLHQLYTDKIPTFIVSGIFRKDQHFFKPYGRWFQQQLHKISHYFVQDEDSEKLLNSIGIDQVSISGDTRFDRVFAIAQKAKKFDVVESYKKGNKIFLAGSTWPDDEAIISGLIKTDIPDLKFIIAPHETSEDRILHIEKLLAGFHPIRFSAAEGSDLQSSKILIIDGIGYLSHLYQYADIAYIGGGFGVGIHNILEAATFGKPILFGPNYQKFKEAVDLIKLKGAFSINTQNELIEQVSNLITDSEHYANSSTACKSYVARNKGATKKIFEHLSEYL